MPGAYQVRRFQPGEESTVADLMKALQDYERGLSDDRPRGDEIAERHFRYLLDECRRKDGRVFVAEMAGDIVAFMVVLVEQLDEGDVHLYPRYRKYGEVTDLFVLPSHRGQGIAGALLKEAEEYGRRRSLSRLYIRVLEKNQAARAFYQRADYIEQDVIYRKDLGI